MTDKELMVFMLELERVTDTLKDSMERIEPLASDSMAEDFLKAFKKLKDETEGTAYAIDQVLTAKSTVGW